MNQVKAMETSQFDELGELEKLCGSIQSDLVQLERMCDNSTPDSQQSGLYKAVLMVDEQSLGDLQPFSVSYLEKEALVEDAAPEAKNSLETLQNQISKLCGDSNGMRYYMGEMQKQIEQVSSELQRHERIIESSINVSQNSQLRSPARNAGFSFGATETDALHNMNYFVEKINRIQRSNQDGKAALAEISRIISQYTYY